MIAMQLMGVLTANIHCSRICNKTNIYNVSNMILFSPCLGY